MMTENPTLYQLKNQSIQIIFGKVVRIIHWQSKSLKSPFWRCYCPLETGGYMVFKGQEYALTPGMGYIIPPLTDFASNVTRSFHKVFAHFNYNTLDQTFSPGIYPFKIEEEMMASMQSYKSPSPLPVNRLQLIMFQLISKGLNTIPDNAVTHKHHEPRIYKLLDLMSNNLKAGIPNMALAKVIGLTEPSMIRLFKEHTGSSPQKHLNSLRLKTASDLLIHSDLSIDEIAEECGFWDRNHFSKSFRKQWTYPPARYRSIHQVNY